MIVNQFCGDHKLWSNLTGKTSTGKYTEIVTALLSICSAIQISARMLNIWYAAIIDLTNF